MTIANVYNDDFYNKNAIVYDKDTIFYDYDFYSKDAIIYNNDIFQNCNCYNKDSSFGVFSGNSGCT